MDSETVLFLDSEPWRLEPVLDELRQTPIDVAVADPFGSSHLDSLATANVAIAVLGIPKGSESRLRMVRALRRAAPELFLLCGLTPDQDDEAEALDAGADGVVLRPYSIPQLRGAISLGLEMRRLRSESRRIRDLSDAPFHQARENFEADYVRRLLTRAHGNMTLAARISHVGRPFLYRKARALGLEPDDFRE